MSPTPVTLNSFREHVCPVNVCKILRFLRETFMRPGQLTFASHTNEPDNIYALNTHLKHVFGHHPNSMSLVFLQQPPGDQFEMRGLPNLLTSIRYKSALFSQIPRIEVTFQRGSIDCSGGKWPCVH